MTFKTLAAAAVICAAVAAPALAEDLTFTLINNSSVNLNELYVSAHEADTWGDDILGTDVLAAGEQGTVTIADGASVCDYDLRFVAEGGGELTGTQNLCELETFTLHD